MNEKKQFTEALCKVLANEQPEVVLALLSAAIISATPGKDSIMGTVSQIRNLQERFPGIV